MITQWPAVLNVSHASLQRTYVPGKLTLLHITLKPQLQSYYTVSVGRVCCIHFPMSGLHSAVVVYVMWQCQISEVSMQLPEWWGTLQMHTCIQGHCGIPPAFL